jgi:hypothetical protein
MAEEPPKNPGVADRRSFIRTAAWGGGIAGLGGLAGLIANRLSSRKPDVSASKPALGEEFTYDVSRFQKSDPALVRYEEISRFPVGLERARNIATGSDGSIFVVGTGGILKFSPEGELLLTIPMDEPVHSIALRPNGEILAGQKEKITVCDSAGAVVSVWSDLPKGMLPTSIALVGEEIFVADAVNKLLWKLDAAGRKTGVIGARDPERGSRGFKIPSPYFCVRMAPDGLLRVTNPGEHQIEAYTLQGDLEMAWGKTSFSIDGFCGCCNPVSFDIFPDGSFVTCEKGLPRVKLYDSHGDFTGVVAGPEAFPEYLKAANAGTLPSLGSGIYAAIDPQGRVLVLDPIGGEVRIMTHKK